MKNEIIHFENYLIEDGGTESSIEEHLKNLSYFEDWCIAQAIRDKEFLQLGAIKEYVKFMQNIPVKIGTQNSRLNSMSKYYDFLKLEGIIKKNPIRNFRIRKQKKTVVRNPMNEKELIGLYNDYVSYQEEKPKRLNFPQRAWTNLRMRLVASLILFQGLHSGELEKLTIQDIDLDKGTVYVPATGRTNSRVIALNQSQIIPFYKYLDSLPSEQEKLFTTNLQNGLQYILEELRGLNPKVQNLRHIRSSVLMNWIKVHGMRKAQYLIGHRYATSTKSYEVQDVKDLSELMETTHLFG